MPRNLRLPCNLGSISNARIDSTTRSKTEVGRQSISFSADRLIRTVVQERAVSPEQWRDILALLRDHRATGMAYERAVEYANRAKSCLAAFPASRERDALMALPDYVLARDR